MKILGISGKREAGKSSLAKFLETDYGFKRVSLADPLKTMCAEIYGLSYDQLWGNQKEVLTSYKRTGNTYFTARDILIREGCLKRSINPNFWCDKLKNSIDFLAKDPTNQVFVIDDIRFLNEIEYFKKLGAKFVRLERCQEAIGKAALDDYSETELDSYKEWDGLLLENFNRDLADLKQFAEYVYTHVTHPLVKP